jgi:hypothetical protein
MPQPKLEIRNPKSEGNPKIRKEDKGSRRARLRQPGFFPFSFRASFGFRASDLEFEDARKRVACLGGTV